MNSLKPFFLGAAALLAVGCIVTFRFLASPDVQDLRHTLSVTFSRNARLPACQAAATWHQAYWVADMPATP